MAEVNEEVILKIKEERFFDEWKTLADLLKRLAQKGYTIKKGKKAGRIAQLLTHLCQKDILEREELPRVQWGAAGGRWKYKKR